MPGVSFGISAMTILGQSMGAKKFLLAKVAVFRSANYSALFMGLMGIVFILFGHSIIGLFTDSVDLIQETYPALAIISIVQIGDAYHMVFGFSLKGAGLMKYVLIAYTLISYFVMLPTAYLLGIYLKLGTVGLWSSVFLWLFGLAIIFFYKFNKGDWKHNTI